MKKHPVTLAAKAAIAELTSESAKEFFRDIAIAHTLMTVFYLFEFCCDTYEAGQKTRVWVEQRRTKSEPPAEAWICAGLLSAAPEEKQQAIATMLPVEIKTNQQKLEDQIIKSIQGIYNDQTIQDHSTAISGCDESDHQLGDQHNLELVQEATDRAIGEVLTVKTTVARTRKTGAASSDRAKSVDKSDSKVRVPRTRNSVSG